MTQPSASRARTDAGGRLASVDSDLLEAVVAAGGAVGAPLPLPALAAVERLVRRLGVPIARDIALGEGGAVAAVRASPDGDGVLLEIAGWYGPADLPAADARTGADWLWETDAALLVTHIDDGVGARFGFDAGAMLGRPLTELFAFGGGGDLPILGAVASGGGFAAQEAVVRGTTYRVRLEAEARRDDAGRFAGYTGAAFAMPAAAPEPPDALPVDRSLRAPLERIIANAASMSARVDGPLSDSYAGYAGDIAAAGRHLLSLVDDLADVAAIEANGFTVEADALDLADAARRAAGLLALRAGEAGVAIDAPSALATLAAQADYRRTLQIIVNLVGNAVRHSPEGGTVWVRVEGDGADACVIVADQGPGIAAADHSRIFDKFVRLDAGGTGSGLGLYISRRLARAMRGDIGVDSAPGQGSRFILRLPSA